MPWTARCGERCLRLGEIIAGGALAACFFSPASAAAQDRLYFEELADVSLYGMTAQPKYEAPRPFAYEWSGGLGVGLMRGRGVPSRAILDPFLAIGIGVGSTEESFLQLYSEARLPMMIQEDGQLALRGVEDLEGAHRIRGQLSFGSYEKLEQSIDIEVEGAFWQAGRSTTSYLRRDVGPYAFRDASAGATLWPGIGMNGEDAIAMPLSYTHRRFDYDTGEGTGGFTSYQIESGLGIHPHERELGHGSFRIGGIAWERALFDESSAPLEPAGAKETKAPRMRSVERVELKLANFDNMVGLVGDEAMLEMSGHLGGAWLWDDETGRELSAFTFSAAMGFTYFDEGIENPDHIGGGLGVARRAGYLADGSALTWGWRIEAFAHVALLKGRAGGRFRMAVEQLSLPGAPAEPRDLGFQSSFSTEWFLVPVSMLEVGIHHTATDQCPGSASLAGDAFCHSMGAFLRVTDRSRGSASEEVEQMGRGPGGVL